MRQRTLAMMSPCTRELLAAYEAAKAEDEASGWRPDLGGEDEGSEGEDAA